MDNNWPIRLGSNCIFPNPKAFNGDMPIAYGGVLSIELLKSAYSFGIFPWYNENEPPIWWCPTPRYVIFPEKIRSSKSMRPYLNGRYRFTINKCFEEVITNCASIKRNIQEGTWITDEMQSTYIDLHKEGIAHSVEVWEKDILVGGLYGVSIGKIFSGESMFASRANASKYALIRLSEILAKHGFYFIDCQIENEHLKSMGGEYLERDSYFQYLDRNRMKESTKDVLWNNY